MMCDLIETSSFGSPKQLGLCHNSAAPLQPTTPREMGRGLLAAGRTLWSRATNKTRGEKKNHARKMKDSAKRKLNDVLLHSFTDKFTS